MISPRPWVGLQLGKWGDGVFTGLIREIGTLRRISRRGGVVQLDIAASRLASGLTVGASVAVNGVCLTVTHQKKSFFQVEAAAETQRLTTLKSWRAGDRVHLEPALRAGDPLDGHLVQGHVDGVGRVLSLRRVQGGWSLTVGLPQELADFLTPKGSVAIDGVSLTVDEGPFTDRFTVNLIPHTMEQTTFAGMRSGRRLNLEMDVLVKAARSGSSWRPATAAEAKASSSAPSLTLDRLLARGFGRLKKPGSKGSR